MPQQIPTSNSTNTIDNTGIDIKSILDPVQVDKTVKHTAWDAYHNSKSPEEFKKVFDGLKLPNNVKHDLWSAKFTPDKYQEELKQRPQKSTAVASAIHPPKSIAEFVSRFTESLGADLRYGSSFTKAGQIYKKLGGQPFYAGNGGAAEFMMSMPLGIIKALEGGGDIGQGKVWQGTKKVVSGVLQAATIPLSFMSPEVGEVGAKAVGKVGEEGASIIKGAKNLLNPKSATLPVQSAPRELKMGEMVQKIVSDNVSHAVGKLEGAKDEVEYMELVIKAHGKADPKLIKTYTEALEKLNDAQELHKQVTKFSRVLNDESPEKIITKLINGGKQDQSYVKSVLDHLKESPKAIKNLQDTTLRGIIEKNTGKSLVMGKKTNWIKVQEDLIQKGDMSKDLLSSRYYPVLQEVNKLAKQQRMGKIVVLTVPTLGLLGLTRAWYLRHAMQMIVQ